MGRQLYEKNLVFRHHMDACSAIVEPELGYSLAQIIYDERRKRLCARRYAGCIGAAGSLRAVS
ncbi:hypothetical protein [Mycoavidus sp. B2-EB]|uniref:hypothetical protein n=1 Tax=Mycoavidus sp. B2-EB TaxID=2651972 RepID=UPI00351CABBF